MTKLLCDIGGTHIRFVHELDDGSLSLPTKIKAVQFSNFIDSIREYLSQQFLDTLQITHFYFAKSGRSVFETDIQTLRGFLPTADIKEINDFEANAYGIALNYDGDVEILHQGTGTPPPFSNKAVMGVGTGLGLAYITHQNHVLRNHGGHMLPSLPYQDHRDLFAFLQTQKVKSKLHAPIFEDAVSGRGLYDIYRYLCHVSHLDEEFRSIEDLMKRGLDHPVVVQALHMFHEMLGLFMHQAVAFGHAYGGVYLTGGMIDKLRLADKLDIRTILETFHQTMVDIVEKDVNATSIYWIKDEFISLKGLHRLTQEKL
jgi:glucokinase